MINLALSQRSSSGCLLVLFLSKKFLSLVFLGMVIADNICLRRHACFLKKHIDIF